MILNDLDAQIKAACGEQPPAAPAKVEPVRWLVCRGCGHIARWGPSDPVPESCTHEGVTARVTVLTEESAARVSEQFKAKAAPAPAPAPAPTAKPRGRPKRAPEPPAPVQQIAAAPVEDRKAARDRAIAALAAKLNQLEPTPVGTGTVDALGFTVWIERDGARVPVYCFKEPTDTPQSFKSELMAARKQDGNVSIDAARISGLSTELIEVAYQGEIVAATRGPKGRVRVMEGARVRIGARLSTHGKPIYVVIGVEE